MITEIRNGYNVKRYHATYRHQEETNGHHSANVCAIMLRLDPTCSRAVLIRGLMHDVPEAATGDIPYQFKKRSPEVRDACEQAEHWYESRYSLPVEPLNVAEMKLFKAADMVDVALSAAEEWGRGNGSARQILRNAGEALDAMELPHNMMAKIDAMVQEVKKQWEIE